jgi:DNA-binding NarL/FixJ family response regulator
VTTVSQRESNLVRKETAPTAPNSRIAGRLESLRNASCNAPSLPAEDERLQGLTDRERDVLRLVAQGLSNAEIAAELFVSHGTVKTHVGRILTKLDLRDRVQAVVLAYEAGLIRPGASERSETRPSG